MGMHTVLMVMHRTKFLYVFEAASFLGAAFFMSNSKKYFHVRIIPEGDSLFEFEYFGYF